MRASRKDFVAIADTFRAEIAQFQLTGHSEDAVADRAAAMSVWRMAHAMADVLAGSNPQFNRQRFLAYALEGLDR